MRHDTNTQSLVRCDEMCCSVLQCVAVCCSVLQLLICDTFLIHITVNGFRTPAHEASGELDSCELGVFQSECFLLLLLRLIFNKHPQIKKKIADPGEPRRTLWVKARQYLWASLHP